MNNPYAVSGAAAEYDRTRPGYPSGALQAIAEGAPEYVADIGAGTGLFTRSIIEFLPNAHITAVEPSEQMRSTWHHLPPQVTLVPGSSESTGLPADSVDRVVWAQSFHWVNPAEAGPETHRILRSGGFGFVIANQMNVSIPWVHRLTRIMRSGDVVSEKRPPKLPGFATSAAQTWQWSQTLSVTETMALARTRSSYLRSSKKNQESMQQNLQWYLEDHLGHSATNPVAIPYLTYLWRLDPIPGPSPT